MSIESIFPQEEFSQTEKDIIKEAFSDPTVIKYLKSLAAGSMKELSALTRTEQPADYILAAHENVNGQLAAFGTLISISES